jgi:hypothetical protein
MMDADIKLFLMSTGYKSFEELTAEELNACFEYAGKKIMLFQIGERLGRNRTMIDCNVSFFGWNFFWRYILLFIDIKAFVTDYLYLLIFLLGPICGMMIMFLLVHIITSQKTGIEFFC